MIIMPDQKKENEEKVFTLIREGNDYLDDGSNAAMLKAAKSFFEASKIMESLSNNSNQKQNICSLFARQSDEYLTKSRDVFLNALKMDCANNAGAQEKAQLFSQLFNNGLCLPPPPAEELLKNKEMSLQERLAALSGTDNLSTSKVTAKSSNEEALRDRLSTLQGKSYTSGISNDPERLIKIRDGLIGLGINVHSNDAFHREEVTDFDDEIKMIIAQTNDEINLGINACKDNNECRDAESLCSASVEDDDISGSLVSSGNSEVHRYLNEAERKADINATTDQCEKASSPKKLAMECKEATDPADIVFAKFGVEDDISIRSDDDAVQHLISDATAENSVKEQVSGALLDEAVTISESKLLDMLSNAHENVDEAMNLLRNECTFNTSSALNLLSSADDSIGAAMKEIAKVSNS
mmetsp:Transcript_15454/g.20130  ORF Transcript_15454/g.20130 Transcript_15454/m.20130 type:complete len:411 (+) Transcript_15454:551-1783(+)